MNALGSIERTVTKKKLTMDTEAFPFSLTFMGNGASKPVSSSFSTTKAWCGRFALPLSFAVKLMLMLDSLERATGTESADLGAKLQSSVSQSMHTGEGRILDPCEVGKSVRVLVAFGAALLRKDCHAALVKTPCGGGLYGSGCEHQEGFRKAHGIVVLLVSLKRGC